MENLEEQLNFWGYTTIPGKENETPFFDYKETANPEHSAKFEGYKQLNEEMWKFVLENKEQSSKCSLSINRGKEGISMMKEKQLYNYVSLLEKATIKESK